MPERLDRAALITVGGPLSQKILGCKNPSRLIRAPREIAQNIIEASKQGAKLIVFVGGEPTARKDITNLLKIVQKLGLQSGLITDGCTFASDDFRSEMLGLGLSYLRIPIHGSQAETHDELVEKTGAFQKATLGIQALLTDCQDDFLVEIAPVITSQNTDEIPSIVRFFSKFPRSCRLGIRYVAPSAGLEEKLWPDLARVTDAIQKAFKQTLLPEKNLFVSWEGFPPCSFGPELAAFRDDRLRAFVPVYGPLELACAISREQLADRIFPLPCQECLDQGECIGAAKDLIDSYGDQTILRPSRGVRANSFNYTLVDQYSGIRIKPGCCPVLKIDLHDDPARSLLLIKDGDQAFHYKTDTGDFSDHQIRKIKVDLEQIYLDLDEKATLGDPSRTIVRLRSKELCQTCPDRKNCQRAFEIINKNPFRREEELIRSEVSQLRGKVLDIGCGEQQYTDILEDLIRAGTIEYHGLDPDPLVIAKFKQTLLGKHLYQGEIETFEGGSQSFDALIAFRSLNHFRDMNLAFENICTMLKEGGTLILCETPPFALLRNAEQIEYADKNAQVGHEHFRNWTSDQVIDFLRPYPLRLKFHDPVSKETSNQWMLKYERIPRD